MTVCGIILIILQIFSTMIAVTSGDSIISKPGIMGVAQLLGYFSISIFGIVLIVVDRKRKHKQSYKNEKVLTKKNEIASNSKPFDDNITDDNIKSKVTEDNQNTIAEPIDSKEYEITSSHYTSPSKNNNYNLEVLLKRVYIFLASQEWKKADEYCEKILDIDPENAEAYLGKLLAELKLNNKELLTTYNQNIENKSNYILALNFSNSSLKRFLIDTAKNIKKQIEMQHKKRTKNIITILIVSISLVTIFLGTWKLIERIEDKKYYKQQLVEQEKKYNTAIDLFDKKDFAQSLPIFISLKDYIPDSSYSYFVSTALDNVNIYHEKITKILKSNEKILRKTEYIYDSNGNLLQEKGQDYIIEYTYSDNGLCVKKTKHSSTLSTKTIEYMYDDSGKCLTEIETNGNDTPITYTYTYNENGQCIQKRNEKETIEYMYDNKGNCIEENGTHTTYRWVSLNGAVTVCSYYYYTTITRKYDSQNNLISEVERESSDYEITPIYTFNEYTYDTYGNLVKRICRNGHENKTHEYIYDYNEYGICYQETKITSGKTNTFTEYTEYFYTGTHITNKN